MHNCLVHSLEIGNHTFFVDGSNTDSLIEIANILEIKFDKILPSRLGNANGIVKIWKIGELADYIKENSIS